MNPDPSRFLSLLIEQALDELAEEGGLSTNPDDDIATVERDGMMAAIRVTFRGGPSVIVEVSPL